MHPEELVIRPVISGDHDRLETIRAAAFAPVFASFRAILGDELYELAQAGQDEGHGAYLRSLLRAGSGWDVYAAERNGEVVGFVSVRMAAETAMGEIGLNAVHPDHSGAGIGTAMYEYALERMRSGGMRVATVGAGGDPSHAPARRAYEKAGFAVGVPSVWLCRPL